MFLNFYIIFVFATQIGWIYNHVSKACPRHHHSWTWWIQLLLVELPLGPEDQGFTGWELWNHPDVCWVKWIYKPAGGSNMELFWKLMGTDFINLYTVILTYGSGSLWRVWLPFLGFKISLQGVQATAKSILSHLCLWSFFPSNHPSKGMSRQKK